MKQLFRRFQLICCAYESLKMPRSQDLAIFVLTTDDRQTDTQTDCFTPAAHARLRGNNGGHCHTWKFLNIV
jgi:hypothetical protein